MGKQTRRSMFKRFTAALFALTGWGIFSSGIQSAFSQPQSTLTGKRNPRHDVVPGYIRLHQNGQLKKRGQELWSSMNNCRLCPRECGVDRLRGREGFCRISSELVIASHNPHFGEEPPLVGRNGSGTIFMANCGLRCVFCINWDIAHEGRGRTTSIARYADMMIELQRMGCGNINIVTPTHYSAHFLLALDRAVEKGLRIPIVYNTHGWERLEILKLLDGVVDIYLPDFKYYDPAMANRFSPGAVSYPEVTASAIKEMQRQVGVARPAKNGLIYRGLMIRHLVMPRNVGGTRGVLNWIGQNLPKDTYVNLMSQYRPAFRAKEYPEINRRLTEKEYSDAVRWSREAGLTNVEIQGFRESFF